MIPGGIAVLQHAGKGRGYMSSELADLSSLYWATEVLLWQPHDMAVQWLNSLMNSERKLHLGLQKHFSSLILAHNWKQILSRDRLAILNNCNTSKNFFFIIGRSQCWKFQISELNQECFYTMLNIFIKISAEVVPCCCLLCFFFCHKQGLQHERPFPPTPVHLYSSR